jgi:hypothetical protein
MTISGIDPLVWVAGHRIEGKLYEFPHMCPGYGCAIAEYLERQMMRRMYEALHPELTQ